MAASISKEDITEKRKVAEMTMVLQDSKKEHARLLRTVDGLQKERSSHVKGPEEWDEMKREEDYFNGTNKEYLAHMIERVSDFESELKVYEERLDEINTKIEKREGDASLTNTIRFLSYRTNVQMAQYELSSRYLSWRHFLFHFLPLQILVTTAAILAFVAASEITTDHKRTATILSTFITTMDRYCKWQSLAEVHKSTGLVYKKVKDDIDLEILTITSGAKTQPKEILEKSISASTKFQERLKNIEELSSDAFIPTPIRMVFEHLFKLIMLAVVADQYHHGSKASDANAIAVNPLVHQILLTATDKVVERITSYRNCIWRWPFFLPDAQVMALEIYHELDFMLRTTEDNDFSGAFHKLTVQVDKKELSEFIKDKKEKRKQPPSPTSPADANAPPFAENMA